MSETNTLTPSPETDLGKPDLERTIAKDFYLSFKYSQGDPFTQENLFVAMRNYYRDEWPADEVERAIDNAPVFFEEAISRYKLPQKHMEIVPNLPSKGESEENKDFFSI